MSIIFSSVFLQLVEHSTCKFNLQKFHSFLSFPLVLNSLDLVSKSILSFFYQKKWITDFFINLGAMEKYSAVYRLIFVIDAGFIACLLKTLLQC